MLWGNSIFRLATLKLDGNGEELFNQAEKKYEQALKIHPDDPTALGNFGSILLKRSQKEKGEKAELLLKKAIKCFQSSIEIREDNYEILNMMGEALIAQARQILHVDPRMTADAAATDGPRDDNPHRSALAVAGAIATIRDG